MKKELIIFPTSRAIRETLQGCNEGFLPTYMGMGDFLDRVIKSEKLTTPDDDLRLLALHEASNFSAFDKLHIERNFFTFIQNSTYLFRFFEELSGEMVVLQALENADVYGEYEEHITILGHLWKNYKEIVALRGWSDPIFSKSSVQINEQYVRGFESITLFIEGYLSRYELEVLKVCASLVPLECIYHATVYNEKMTERLRECSLEIEVGYRYRFSLSERAILERSKIEPLRNVTCEVFHNRLTQVGFVKAHVQMMIDSGIAPERLVVVVPDEEYVAYLALFDEEGNFNFAMGHSIGEERFIRDIDAIELFMSEQNAENKARLTRVNEQLYTWVKEHYYEPFSFHDLESLAEMVSGDIHRLEVKKILDEELEKFKPIATALEEYEFKSALKIFMNRLKSRSLDDVGGGKITVMGLLETRGVAYDGVIVVDFNEGFVPHRSQKDLFLNTKTRQFADLPTSMDREFLQKHYYWMLFERAQKVAISCVQNSETIPSRFLLQLGIPSRDAMFDYGHILFPHVTFNERLVSEMAGVYDFTAHTLSASGLKSFLTCKRQFYYKYVARIKDHELQEDLSRERDIGNRLHNAMEKIYMGRDHYGSAQAIKEALVKVLSQEEEGDVMQRYVQHLWIEKLTPFYENEIQRFEEGIRVAYHEKTGEKVVEGIPLGGRIDRIDFTHEGLEVLDYKTGNFADTDHPPKEGDVDYQLAIYALLAEEFGRVSRCGYYDLKSGRVVYEQFLEAKIETLRGILHGLASYKEWVWEQCKELKACRLCPYAVLCDREL
ncbi:MAG: PD-(D/E)XK nuclease family protein [Sulfurimonas sp.]|jgi:RecB family exonuclease